MKKGNLYFFLLLIIIVTGIYFLFLSPKKASPRAAFKRHYEQPLAQIKVLHADNLKGAYRLFPFRDSLLVLAEGGNFVIDQQLLGVREINDLPDSGTIYFASQSADSLATFDIDKKEMTLRVADNFFENKINGLPGNAIYNSGKFYFDLGDDRMTGSETLIVSWNPANGCLDTIANLNKLVADHIPGYHDCLSQTLEGNFFSIAPGKFGYFFYYGGYFLIFDESNIHLKQTIDSSPFRKFELKTVTLPGGRKAAQCYSASSTHCNYAAFSDTKNIYILSGVISVANNKELYAPVDVYDVARGSYLHTLRVPMSNLSDYAYLMTVLGDYIYIYFRNNKLIRYKI